MALPLNRYKTVYTTTLSSGADTTVYTAPVGYNSVILSIAACNTASTQKDVTIRYNRGGSRVDLVNGFVIPGNDTADLTTGKLIVEQNDSLVARATDDTVHLTISILETKI